MGGGASKASAKQQQQQRCASTAHALTPPAAGKSKSDRQGALGDAAVAERNRAAHSEKTSPFAHTPPSQLSKPHLTSVPGSSLQGETVTAADAFASAERKNHGNDSIAVSNTSVSSSAGNGDGRGRSQSIMVSGGGSGLRGKHAAGSDNDTVDTAATVHARMTQAKGIDGSEQELSSRPFHKERVARVPTKACLRPPKGSNCVVASSSHDDDDDDDDDDDNENYKSNDETTDVTYDYM